MWHYAIEQCYKYVWKVYCISMLYKLASAHCAKHRLNRTFPNQFCRMLCGRFIFYLMDLIVFLCFVWVITVTYDRTPPSSNRRSIKIAFLIFQHHMKYCIELNWMEDCWLAVIGTESYHSLKWMGQQLQVCWYGFILNSKCLVFTASSSPKCNPSSVSDSFGFSLNWLNLMLVTNTDPKFHGWMNHQTQTECCVLLHYKPECCSTEYWILTLLTLLTQAREFTGLYLFLKYKYLAHGRTVNNRLL